MDPSLHTLHACRESSRLALLLGAHTTLLPAGNHSLGVLDLFKTLAAEAEAAGGKVVTLLGNHEAMLITVRGLLGGQRGPAPEAAWRNQGRVGLSFRRASGAPFPAS